MQLTKTNQYITVHLMYKWEKFWASFNLLRIDTLCDLNNTFGWIFFIDFVRIWGDPKKLLYFFKSRHFK